MKDFKKQEKCLPLWNTVLRLSFGTKVMRALHCWTNCNLPRKAAEGEPHMAAVSTLPAIQEQLLAPQTLFLCHLQQPTLWGHLLCGAT